MGPVGLPEAVERRILVDAASPEPHGSDVLNCLTTALADRYRVERKIGGRGMATVYLAEDLKHHREVRA